MSEAMKKISMGWLPDHPCIRDIDVNSDKVPNKPRNAGQKHPVKKMLKKANVSPTTMETASLPDAVDLREWCPLIEDQKNLASCTANAAVGLLEYFEKRSFGKYIEASRLFLYKVTRNLMQITGNVPVSLRKTMEALVLFGVPPEKYYPYDTEKVDEEPSAFCYSFARDYRALTYYRLDPIGTSKDLLLRQIKTNLAAGLASMFGFTAYNSIYQSLKSEQGKIPFPSPAEKILGGHAVVAVGYDDSVKIKNEDPKSSETTGALLIRNSVGGSWGMKGYGWLPYEYVLKGLTQDWWSLLKIEWIDTGEFRL